MQHHIRAADLGPDGEGMARAVTSCVHCGFCLAACPTYKVMGEEMDSPRGRIMLMKQVLEGDLAGSDAQPYIDRCLGCLACETACPSGVRYRDLLVPFRARSEANGRTPVQRWTREAMLSVLESPARFRAAHLGARIARRISVVLPVRLREMIALLPPELPPAEALPERTPAVAPRRARVALLAGCVQQVLRPAINAAAVRLLAANGVEVVVPRSQGCCGALALHTGLAARGEALAEHNVQVFPADVDAIITTTAGCGSAMKERAHRAPVRDVLEFLDALGLRTPLALPQPLVAAYHDACHLSHGQGVRLAPRRILAQVRNLTIAELSDGEMCCGSAGLYNLEQPDTARELGRRKANAVAQTGAALVVTGNIGCMTQIQAHAAIPVQHTLELLDLAYSAA